jgi:peptidyl-tRNA hydrolase
MTEAATVPEGNVDPVVCYVLVRTDVPNWLLGKTCAQTHHNGSQMLYQALKKNEPALNREIDEWMSETGAGFGTALTLAVPYAIDMRNAVALAQIIGLHAAITHDPTYPIIDGDRVHTLPVDTCAYVFGRKSLCQRAIARFNLLSERDVK